jgi:hypothetical protein
MKLTRKDLEFLRALRRLLEDQSLRVEVRRESATRLVLRRNYGEHIEQTFRVTRQGVRWRFNHLMNEMYVSALTTILLIESHLGTGLRGDAMQIARERAAERKAAQEQAEKAMGKYTKRGDSPS